MNLPPEALKLIGALQFDPGYLLLLDLFKAKFDDLTDELANPDLPSAESQSKLRYWQAFREILEMLRVTPANFSTYGKEEPETSAEVFENDYQTLAKLSKYTYSEDL